MLLPSQVQLRAVTSDLPSLMQGLLPGDGGEEITSEHLAAFWEALAPLVDYVTHGGQRYGQRTKTEGRSIAQRIFVLTHILKPGVCGFRNMVEIGRHLGVCRSMIMRHMKDFNAAFGVYAPGQKRVSVAEQGVFREAGLRGHETRRRRQQEAAEETNYV
jgi:hypothetical protein